MQKQDVVHVNALVWLPRPRMIGRKERSLSSNLVFEMNQYDWRVARDLLLQAQTLSNQVNIDNRKAKWTEHSHTSHVKTPKYLSLQRIFSVKQGN
jgi:hypothetical protein